MLLLSVATGLVLLGAASPVWADDVDGDGVGNLIDVCDNTPPGMAVDTEGRPLGDVDLDCDNDLDDHALSQQGFTGPLAPPPAMVIETVPVGNPGNANDTHGDGYGGVDYAYNIGRYEVTAGQYTEFLNAVADEDTYLLYSTLMWSDADACKIERTGSPGSYTYSVAPDRADRPVTLVSWGDAARFCNWLHNGQPTGAQDLTTTEDGSYYLHGATTDGELIAIVREPDATWVIPSEGEWYKAAYHYNDGVTGNYWDYPTASDTAPTSEAPPGTDMTNGSANYDRAIAGPYYRTEIGAYDARPSDSAYGTFDQGGNVWEWNEAVIGSLRGMRGGSFSSFSVSYLRAWFRLDGEPSMKFDSVGFRVAEVR
jgi:formylglycine-generating enzyme required for sulfatase activity